MPPPKLSRTKEQRLSFLEREKDSLEKRIKALELMTVERTKQIETLFRIVMDIQPILGRLIAIGVVLENKDIINGNELKEVNDQAADNFITSAHPQFAEKVRGKSPERRPVESGLSDRHAGVLGTPSNGGTTAGNIFAENAKRASLSRLSDVRTTHGPSDGVDNVSTAEKKDLPIG